MKRAPEWRSLRLRAATIARLRAAASVMGLEIEELAEKIVDEKIPAVGISKAQLQQQAEEAEDLLDKEASCVGGG
jgi:DNA-binding PucR family transcriptional regulator